VKKGKKAPEGRSELTFCPTEAPYGCGVSSVQGGMRGKEGKRGLTSLRTPGGRPKKKKVREKVSARKEGLGARVKASLPCVTSEGARWEGIK